MNMIEKAIKIALDAHSGQVDKANKPYILHPLRLMLKMKNELDMITAVLHDVLEDSSYTEVELLREGVPEDVVNAVKCMTKDGAQTDSNTLRANVTYNGGNVILGDVSSTSRPQEVVVDVTTAFDGSSTINIGDDNDNDRLMSDSYIDLGNVGTYTVTPKFVYMDTVDANNTIKAYVVAGTSSQGAASIMISYS